MIKNSDNAVGGELRYLVGSINLVFTSRATEVLARHRQRCRLLSEAGGQLFGTIKGNSWEISHVTGVRKGDIRSRFGFRPSRRAEQEEINRLHDSGLTFLGDWHTHPENLPAPSMTDTESMAEMVRESRHDLPGFLLCIVGRDPFPSGLWVSFHARSGQSIKAKLLQAP